MKLFRKARRRRPGVYAYRTRKHLRRGVEWGYVGESTNLPLRAKCHAGTCRHATCAEKPWYDLKVGYWELRLPWWLGWKWVLRSIETILIVVLRPRYNVAKNRRRGRVPLSVAKVQRANRDRMAAHYSGRIADRHALDYLIRATAVALILAGPIGWYLTR